LKGTKGQGGKRIFRTQYRRYQGSDPSSSYPQRFLVASSCFERYEEGGLRSLRKGKKIR
jgi:hypothetical protein